MNLRSIFTIPGKAGVFQMVSQNKNGAIMESLLDGRRFPIFTHEKISSLEEICIYTDSKEEPLKSIFQNLFRKLDGQVYSSNTSDSKALGSLFAEILPNYDRQRVYASDIKKVFAWYNILVAKSLIDLESDDSTDDAPETDPGA